MAVERAAPARRAVRTTSRRPSTAAIALVWIGVACGPVTAPLPPEAQRFSPPAIYTRWWAMTEACSGRARPMADIQWYQVPGDEVDYHGVEGGGFWTSAGNRIVLAAGETDDGALVRHEMLHALGVPGHQRTQFLGTCAALVRCSGGCVSDAGPWQPPRSDYVTLPWDSFQVTSHAQLLPREADGQRWLAQVVTVRNPRAYAVVATPPPFPVPPGSQPPTPSGFAFTLYGGAGHGNIHGWLVADDPSKLFFEPLETKSWRFEFRVASDLSLIHVPPGTYAVLGSFLWQSAAPDTVVVVP